MKTLILIVLVALLGVAFGSPTHAQDATPKEARAIAKEAYLWGYSLVDDYRIQYAYFVDKTNPEFKGGWNVVANNTRLYTPADTTIQTINSDTLYSFIGLDLRDEPIVITVPQVEKGRYYGCSLFDLWGYVEMFGTRTTGNDAANFLVAGPSWKGETPKGIKKVFRMETTLATAAFRTQLFNPGDIDNVKKVQSGYKVQTLSSYLGQPAPKRTPLPDIKPLTVAEEKTSLEFFNLLNQLLPFAPTDPSEVDLRKRVAKIGIDAGVRFDTAKLSPEMKTAIEQGRADAWADLDAAGKKLNSGELSASDCYGTREDLKNNYLNRAAGIVLGGNAQPKQEVIYPVIAVDAEGKPLNGGNKYTIRYPGNDLPPAKFFWSLTMYGFPSRLLVANPINRYLLNTPMLPNWVKDDDGGYTFYIQNESPGKDKEANWLPAPKDGFYMVMRLYGPSKEAQDGIWKAPRPTRVN